MPLFTPMCAPELAALGHAVKTPPRPLSTVIEDDIEIEDGGAPAALVVTHGEIAPSLVEETSEAEDTSVEIEPSRARKEPEMVD